MRTLSEEELTEMKDILYSIFSEGRADGNDEIVDYVKLCMELLDKDSG